MNETRRLFSSRQKIALWLIANELCQICNKPLPRNWEADHRIPHSKGGHTHVSNGQAVCRQCNRSKGASHE